MSLGPPQRFQQLIEELLTEHDREVQLLKVEKEQLREQIGSLDLAGALQKETEQLKVEIQELKAEIARLRSGEEPFFDHPLAEESADELLPEPLEGPPTVTIDSLPQGNPDEVFPNRTSPLSTPTVRKSPPPLDDVDESSKPKPGNSSEHEAFSKPMQLERTGSNEDHVQVVRAIAYAINLPGSALPGDWDPAEAKLVVAVKCGEFAGEIPPTGVLQQEIPVESDLPNQISSEVAWTAAWGEEGGDALLHVPKSMLDKTIPFDVETAGSGIRIGGGMMNLNSTRQQWMLDCGGFLEGEIHIEKATTPAGRRASTTTRTRIIERLEKLFDVTNGAAKVVMPADLGLAMRAATFLNTKSGKKHATKFESRLAPEDLEEVMMELRRIHQKAIEKTRKTMHSQPVLSWGGFVECMLLSDLPKFSQGHAALHLFIVQRELLGDEMPAKGTSEALLMAYEKAKKPISKSQRWVSIVTALSTAAIIISFAFMGISLDTDPDWSGWIVLDSLCAVIFVAEVVVKSVVLTPREYFFGRDCIWNLFDVGLSFVAVTEIVLELIFASVGSQTRAALALRGLRLARMARLAKLMRMPLLEELANLISGFVISVRSLFWVMIFLWLIVYVIALGFRAGVQTVSESTAERCGYGDFYDFELSPDRPSVRDLTDPPLPPGCKLHYMYGVEFCGSVFGCMFSIFRCMISECTSKGGRSLTMIFSDGFGIQFDVFYAASMVVVLFGLFNIITAIFVEATLNGLKENEVQRRYAKAYESNYMTEQLAKLVITVSAQVERLRSRTALPALMQMGLSSGNSVTLGAGQNNALQNGEIYLSEEEFNQLVRLPDVRMILNDLDVSVEPRPGIFEAFNTEEDGTVSLSELVSGLMRLRGDLHKVDMVIAQMSLDQMQKQLGDLKKAHESNKETNQRNNRVESKSRADKSPVRAKVVARARSRVVMPKASATDNTVSPG